MTNLAGKVVLVSGAGRGVGRAAAQAFAAQGAVIAANDITPINLDVTLEKIWAAGGQAKEYICDVGKKMPVESMVDQVLSDWGRIDILVNATSVQPRAALLDIDEWDWRRAIDVNLSGVFFMIQLVGRAMRAQGGGVIVNILPAVGGQMADPPTGWTERAAFIASKMGVIGLTQAAAYELSAYNIRVNAVCLSGFDTQPQQEDLAPFDSSLRYSDQAQEAAEAALLLCSEDVTHLTGQILYLSSRRCVT